MKIVRMSNVCLFVALVFAFGILAGCATQPRTDNNVTPPAPTRAPTGDNVGVDDRTNNDLFDNRTGMLTDGNRFDNDRNRNNMRLADDIANRLTNMREIDEATVFLTGNTAYVAVDMPGRQEGQLTNNLKDRIADEVRHLDTRIDNVYVSADPDFFSRMGAYARDIRNGRPISGLANEITETLRRIFPTAE